MSGRKIKPQKKEDETTPGNVFILPQRKTTEMMKKEEVLSIIKNLGVTLDTQFKIFIRIPGSVVRGSVESYEFHDIFSTQPFPTRLEDRPTYCLSKKLPPPEWVKRWYLCISEDDGKKIITFIDVPRGVAIQGAVEDQDRLSSQINDRINALGEH